MENGKRGITVANDMEFEATRIRKFSRQGAKTPSSERALKIPQTNFFSSPNFAALASLRLRSGQALREMVRVSAAGSLCLIWRKLSFSVLRLFS